MIILLLDVAQTYFELDWTIIIIVSIVIIIELNWIIIVITFLSLLI
jgi:hypothetical protein